MPYLKFLALGMLISSAAIAQNISCALSGTVQDPSNAVMTGAQVTLTSEDKGFVRTTTTNSSGFFSFPDLTAATFTLSVTAPGFRPYRQTGIAINSSEQRSMGTIRLQIGDVSEAVTVSAEAVAVNTTTGEKAGSLDAKDLEGLALRGRDIFDAVALMPGVVDTSDGRDAPGPGSIGNIYIAGGRNDQKNMTIDGVTNLDTGSNGSIHQMPSMDSVAELKVLTSNYAPEYGRNSGGTITVITKGGGKDFHGSASWSYRHEDLNANDFFANVAGRQKTPYRYNIAGYTIHGPVRLPHFNRDRNKLFFMFSQEFQHQLVAYGVKTVTVPNAGERNGDFTQDRNTNGSLITIEDPLNAKKAFPGNIIPASRITPVGHAVLNLFPLPNYVDPNPSRLYNWNYYSSEAGSYPRRTDTLRTDFSPRDNWQVYVRLSNNSDEQHVPYNGCCSGWVTGSLNYLLTPIVYGQPGRGLNFHTTNTLSPTIFNELIIGISQNTLTYYPQDYSKVDRTKLGIDIPQRDPSLNPYNMIPNMSFGSVQNAANPSMSNGTPYWNRNTIYSLVDNVSKIWETHTFKFGAYLERTRKVQFADAATRGTIAFDRDNTNNILDANDAYANALLGNYDSYAEATGRPRGDFRFRNYEFYAQDTWKVTPRLSLDLGIRFYADPPQYDVQHQLHSFLPSLFDPAQAPLLMRPAKDAAGNRVAVDPRNGTIYPVGLIGTFAPNSGNPADGMYAGGLNGYPAGMYNMPAILTAPRIGFAWSPFPTSRTVIRGGFGVFYDRLQGNPTMGTLPNPPTVFTPTNYYGTLADIQSTVSSGLLAPTGTVYSLAGQNKGTAAYNFSLNVSRQFGSTILAEVSYVGSLGRHLIWERNLNAVPLAATFLTVNPQNKDATTNSAYSANFLRPYQGYGNIYLYEFAGTSNYNSLQASMSQRLRHGVSLGGAYTFSKALDESDGYSSSVDPFYKPRMWNYGPAGYDRSQVFSGRYTWMLPKPGHALRSRPLSLVTDNWEISGITRMISGGPFTPTYSMVTGIDFTGSSSGGNGARPYVMYPGAPDIARFTPPVWTAANVPNQGDAGRNILRGPGVNNWDISVYKNFTIREGRLRGQLRFETYNTFNHTQFSTYDQTMNFANVSPQPNPSALNKLYTQINPLFMQPNAARPARRAAISARLDF